MKNELSRIPPTDLNATPIADPPSEYIGFNPDGSIYWVKRLLISGEFQSQFRERPIIPPKKLE